MQMGMPKKSRIMSLRSVTISIKGRTILNKIIGRNVLILYAIVISIDESELAEWE